MDFSLFPQLTFAQPDIENFRNLALSYEALNRGGNLACALNAANEISVAAFLSGEITFTEIAKINEAVMNKTGFIQTPDLDAYIATDAEARKHAAKMVDKLKKQ
jgi:1-deoxy-D-xylulose-5-phosphate reductoisomerase